MQLVARVKISGTKGKGGTQLSLADVEKKLAVDLKREIDATSEANRKLQRALKEARSQLALLTSDQEQSSIKIESGEKRRLEREEREVRTKPHALSAPLFYLREPLHARQEPWLPKLVCIGM